MTPVQRAELNCAKRACNTPKSRLLDVIAHLRTHELDDDADKLADIVAQLEGWQQ